MKKQNLLFFFTFLLSFIINNNLFAVTCTSLATGDWNNPATWSCGVVPGCGDIVTISHKVTVTTNQDYRSCGSNSIHIVITGTGTLHFADGAKLRLPCGSGVDIQTGGKITTNSYNGNSEELEMGGGSSGCSVTTLWQSSNGQVNGPTVLGSGLPIELLSFEAYFNQEVVQIIWKTASETNNDYFTIERSSNGIDFEFLSMVDGAGNSNAVIEYLEKDQTPLIGDSYYRLKQTDYDGNYSYSQTVLVKSSSELSGKLNLYPNPTEDAFHLQLIGFSDEEFLIVIRDITGKQHYSKAFVTSTECHIEAIDPSHELAAGTYIITVSSRNEFHTQKLIVK